MMNKTMVATRLQGAIDKIKDLHVKFDIEQSQPISDIISKISDVDQEKSLLIARTLAAMQAFDELVADNLRQTNYADRFNDITDGFNDIVEDAMKQIKQEEKGGPSLSDRFSNVVMKITRGDISDRFSKIENIFKSVIDDAQKTIGLQGNILEAYSDARLSLKESEIAAIDIHEVVKVIHQEAKSRVQAAANEVDALKNASASDRAQAELARDEALAVLRKEDDRLQIAKDLAEMLTVSYSVTETTFGKYNQAYQVLDRLYKKAVMFFNINRPVMSSLKATYTGILVVNELAKAQVSMQDGMNKSLEALASLGNSALTEGLRVAHAPGIKATSVKALVDSIVQFQEESHTIIEENRRLSTEEAEKIRAHVETGKVRVAELAARYP